MTDLAPFQLVETTPGDFSLLLSQFEPATPIFEAVGSPGGGYAWASVARHLVEHEASELGGRLGFDPEGSMFCAYGRDREALVALGARLARLFHDHAALAALVRTIPIDD